MKKILVLLAHPKFEKSRANQALIRAVADLPGLSIRDLYELYPDFNIDIAAEQAALLEHHIVVWHHPIYWYSCPPLLKQWIDLVLEVGWAYGKGGEQLKSKWIFNAVTSGGSREVYQVDGRNRFTLRQFLAPFEQTAWLCHMRYLPAFAVQGTHRLNDAALLDEAETFRQRLQALQTIPDNVLDQVQKLEYLNDWEL